MGNTTSSQSGGCHSGGGRVRMVYQDHKDEKNSAEFYEHKRSPRVRLSF